MSAAKILSHRKMKVFKLPALGECDQGFTICYEVAGLKLIHFGDCIFPMFIKYSMVLKCSCKSHADESSNNLSWNIAKVTYTQQLLQ